MLLNYMTAQLQLRSFNMARILLRLNEFSFNSLERGSNSRNTGYRIVFTVFTRSFSYRTPLHLSLLWRESQIYSPSCMLALLL